MYSNITVKTQLACHRSFPTIQYSPFCAAPSWQSILGTEPSPLGANGPVPSQGEPPLAHEQHRQESKQLWKTNILK